MKTHALHTNYMVLKERRKGAVSVVQGRKDGQLITLCPKDSGALGGHAWEASVEEAVIHSGREVFKVTRGNEI